MRRHCTPQSCGVIGKQADPPAVADRLFPFNPTLSQIVLFCSPLVLGKFYHGCVSDSVTPENFFIEKLPPKLNSSLFNQKRLFFAEHVDDKQKKVLLSKQKRRHARNKPQEVA